MSFRTPIPSDIGKTVEACADGWQHNESNWGKYTLAGIWQSEIETRYHVSDAKTGYTFVAEHCRVPYSCPDAIAELSEAADLLAERGADYAASVLMQEAERLNKQAEMKELHARRIIAADNCAICNGAGGRWDAEVQDQWYACECQALTPNPEPQ